jgi:small subunit ribosomal protein S6e
MKQGIMMNGRTRMLFRGRATTYRPRRTGERKRRSVRGCIYGADLAVIFLRLVKKGEKEIEGVTTVDRPNRKAPKRANNIRKMYALVKGKDDVCKYVNRRTITRGDKTFWKAPNVQRLVTEKRIRRKQVAKRDKLRKYKSSKEQVEKYEKVLNQYVKEKKAERVKAAKEADAAKVVEAPKVEVKAKTAAPTKVAPKSNKK